MNVHVRLRVCVVERQPGGGETLELRADLRFELRARARFEEEAHTGARQVRQERTASIDEVGDAPGRQNRAAVNEHDVQADGEIGKSQCACDGVNRRRRADHQTRGTQNTVAVSEFDCFVDFGCGAEIVGVDN